MENLIIIMVIGKDGIFKKGGCPLHNNDYEYDNYFRTLTDGYPVILGKDMYEGLPDKSPPFPCRDVYIITGTESLDIDPKLTHTLVVFNLETALTLCEDKERIIILADYPLYNEAFYDHYSEIANIIVVRLDENVEGTKVFEDPPFDWVPVIIKEGSGFTITKYTFHPSLFQ